jgi:sec-independent protein translocase protein TatB
MFDIGFSKIVLIFLLALIVLGPEKLPKVAAQVGRWVGRARGMARQFREQLEEEVNLEEVRRAQAASRASSASESTPPPAAAHASSSSESASTASASTASNATSASSDASSNGTVTSPPEPEQPAYQDTYSHAHPTDHLGRAIPAASPEPGEAASGQQDWVSGVSHPDSSTVKPTEAVANAAYAPPHERGT